MKAPYAYIVHFEGRDVECYGELKEDSDFSVVCDDEYDDDVWCANHPITGLPFSSWEEVVESLRPYFGSDILEITAV
jgi:hypothetical protein